MKKKHNVPINVAVMGTGRWGKNLVRVLASHPDASLNWLIDPNPDHLASAHALAPSAQPVDHISATQYDFDAAVIATPAAAHTGHVIELFSQNKHVFVEKPASLTLAETESLIQMSQALNRVFMVGHQLLYHPGFTSLCRMGKQGDIGKIRHIEAIRSASLDMEKEPGVLWSLGPHDLAMILHLLNASPNTICCQYTPKVAPQRAVEAEINLKFNDELTANIFLHNQAAVKGNCETTKTRYFQVIGDKGTLEFNDTGPTPLLLLKQPQQLPKPVNFPSTEPLYLEMSHFLSCIGENRPPVSGGHHILEVARILNHCNTFQ